jgi:hypothetical protein
MKSRRRLKFLPSLFISFCVVMVCRRRPQYHVDNPKSKSRTPAGRCTLLAIPSTSHCNPESNRYIIRLTKNNNTYIHLQVFTLTYKQCKCKKASFPMDIPRIFAGVNSESRSEGFSLVRHECDIIYLLTIYGYQITGVFNIWKFFYG